MSATPALKTDTSSGRVGRVTIANSYPVSGPLGVTPSAQVAVDGSDAAFNQPSSGVVPANEFSGRVVAIGPTPGDYTGSNTLVDSVIVRITGAGRVVTMPSTPWDGMRVAVVDADGSSAFGDTIQVSVGAGQSIQNPDNLAQLLVGAGFYAFSGTYRRIEWEWNQTASAWFVATDNRPGHLPPTPIASGTLNLSGRGWVKCSPTGAITINLPAIVEEGLQVRVDDCNGGAASHTITIAANTGAGWNIDTLTLGGPGATATISTANQCATWAADVPNKVWRLVAINGPHA